MNGRRATLLVIWLLILSSFSFAVVLLPTGVRATTHFVGGVGPGNYTTIQDAIDIAISFDTIYVYSGIYYEHLVIDVSVTLIGEDKTTTIIDGGGTSTVVSITADGVVLTGFTVRNSGSGGGDEGTYLSMVQDCHIEGNIVTNTETGIFLWNSHYNTIANNTVQDSEKGIFLSGSDHNTVTNNKAYNNTQMGINAGGSAYTQITNNYASGSWWGISVGYADGGTVYNNTAENNGDGIHLVFSSNITVQNNYAEGNEYGIAVWYEFNNTITDNTVIRNTKAGLYTHKTNNNTIMHNTAIDNHYGFNLAFSDDNLVMYNDAFDNDDTGLGLYSSNRTMIVENNVSDNDHIGFRIWMSWFNNIYHNTIVGNHDIEGLGFMGYNYWDNGYPSGGNYWGDYTHDDERSGPDQDQPGHEGIGDLPYDVMGGSNQDRYPLMNSPMTSPPYPPYKPKDLTATGSNNRVLLTWSAPAYDGGSPITNYIIYRDTSIGGIEFLAETGNVLEYTDDDVTNGQNYYYRISAKNAVGESQWTYWVSVAPDNQEPTCEIVTPKSGMIVSGTCTIEGSSSDPDGTVERVDIRIGSGSWQTATGTESWSFDWDTTSYSNGDYSIEIRVWDGQDFSTLSSVSITVNNPDDPIATWGWTPLPLLIVLIVIVIIVAALVLRRRSRMREYAQESPQLEEAEELPPPPAEVHGEELPPPPPDFEEDIPPPPEEPI
ncbi:MAG: right-handed parallel beta-helix repeat-containing protein [Thermoplasmata archaeon]|nr:right-handed parallel beta-helix repeat-containing protein [Thermoplasmata archaeon]